MAFPAISAVEAGYKVFCFVDASGNGRKRATDLTVDRISQAGVIPIDINALLGELMETWNRPDARDFASITIEQITPAYRTVMENYDKAQSVQKVGRETNLNRLNAAQTKK